MDFTIAWISRMSTAHPTVPSKSGAPGFLADKIPLPVWKRYPHHVQEATAVDAEEVVAQVAEVGAEGIK